MEVNIISSATKRNWHRLGTRVENRLVKGANKRFSSKNIKPVEYFNDINNLCYLNDILEIAKALDIKTVIYSLALNLLSKNEMILLKSNNSFECPNIFLKEILNDFAVKIDKKILFTDIPQNEPDFLGIVYQSLLKEGSKNINGSYYTPKSIIKNILNSLSSDSIFLDPCCGTGSFLLNAADIVENPNNLYGVDKDEIACFISKINLIIRFKDLEFSPNIFHADFLTDGCLKEIKFDVIATNPPWGAKLCKNYEKFYPQILSGETFSYFIVKSNSLLKKNGKAVFVLPQSILNVASHKDVRSYILDNFNIKSINLLGRGFSGVLSNVVILELNKQNKSNNVEIIINNKNYKVSQDVYKLDENYNFSIINNRDFGILKKIYSIEHETLKNSTFALGIVTGNNRKYLTVKESEGYEKIYTGKEVRAYFLNPAKKYVKYEREKFQQVASDEIYRSKEKLVYKFISSTPVFAYDDTSSLFLNSANIIIPQVETHSVKTVLAFLNSNLFKYIYMKKFNDLKILKSNLSRLPFPLLTEEKLNNLEQLVNHYYESKSEKYLEYIDEFVYECFKLNRDDILYIKSN